MAPAALSPPAGGPARTAHLLRRAAGGGAAAAAGAAGPGWVRLVVRFCRIVIILWSYSYHVARCRHTNVFIMCLCISLS